MMVLGLVAMSIQYLGIPIGLGMVGAALYLEYRHKKKGVDLPKGVTKNHVAICAVVGLGLIIASSKMISQERKEAAEDAERKAEAEALARSSEQRRSRVENSEYGRYIDQCLQMAIGTGSSGSDAMGYCKSSAARLGLSEPQ